MTVTLHLTLHQLHVDLSARDVPHANAPQMGIERGAAMLFVIQTGNALKKTAGAAHRRFYLPAPLKLAQPKMNPLDWGLDNTMRWVNHPK